MKKPFCVVLAVMLPFVLTGCGQKAEETVFAMDTVMELQVWGPDRDAGIRRVTEILQQQENMWSATRDTSVLSALNRGRQWNWMIPSSCFWSRWNGCRNAPEALLILIWEK